MIIYCIRLWLPVSNFKVISKLRTNIKFQTDNYYEMDVLDNFSSHDNERVVTNSGGTSLVSLPNAELDTEMLPVSEMNSRKMVLLSLFL